MTLKGPSVTSSKGGVAIGVRLDGFLLGTEKVNLGIGLLSFDSRKGVGFPATVRARVTMLVVQGIPSGFSTIVFSLFGTVLGRTPSFVRCFEPMEDPRRRSKDGRRGPLHSPCFKV